MAAIRDIAQLAGVSQGTVSHMLNGKGNVSSEKILVSGTAVSGFSDSGLFHVRFLDRVRPKGNQEVTEIYEVNRPGILGDSFM